MQCARPYYIFSISYVNSKSRTWSEDNRYLWTIVRYGHQVEKSLVQLLLKIALIRIKYKERSTIVARIVLRKPRQNDIPFPSTWSRNVGRDSVNSTWLGFVIGNYFSLFRSLFCGRYPSARFPKESSNVFQLWPLWNSFVLELFQFISKELH